MDGILAVTSYVIYPWHDAMPAQNKKCLNMKNSKRSRLVLLLMIISSDGLNIGGWWWILVCEMTSAVLVVLLPVLVVSAGVLECTSVGTQHSHQLSPAPAVSGWRSLVTVHWSPRSLRPLNMADLEYKKQECFSCENILWWVSDTDQWISCIMSTHCVRDSLHKPWTNSWCWSSVILMHTLEQMQRAPAFKSMKFCQFSAVTTLPFADFQTQIIQLAEVPWIPATEECNHQLIRTWIIGPWLCELWWWWRDAKPRSCKQLSSDWNIFLSDQWSCFLVCSSLVWCWWPVLRVSRTSLWPADHHAAETLIVVSPWPVYKTHVLIHV